MAGPSQGLARRPWGSRVVSGRCVKPGSTWRGPSYWVRASPRGPWGATGTAALAETEVILKSAASSEAEVRLTQAAAVRGICPPRLSGDLTSGGLAYFRSRQTADGFRSRCAIPGHAAGSDGTLEPAEPGIFENRLCRRGLHRQSPAAVTPHLSVVLSS